MKNKKGILNQLALAKLENSTKIIFQQNSCDWLIEPISS
jgi:hypothetical protein